MLWLMFNSLWPSGAIWYHKIWSVVGYVMIFAITWTNVELSLVSFCDNEHRAISQKVPVNLIRNICSDMTPIFKN